MTRTVQLSLDRVPDSGAPWTEIIRFAMTFDGYEEHGSFERCAEIANARRADTLSDLRTCLFFEVRRWRHFGDGPVASEQVYVRELVERIRERVAAGER